MTKQEFLAASLPYNLKIKHFDANRESEHICKIEVWHNEEVIISDGEYEYDLLLNDILPILRPLSDLTKPIEHKGEAFVPIVEIDNRNEYIHATNGCISIGSPLIGYRDVDDMDELPTWVTQYLVKRHFDIADLISKGEAIDVNTLEENPYK